MHHTPSELSAAERQVISYTAGCLLLLLLRGVAVVLVVVGRRGATTSVHEAALRTVASGRRLDVATNGAGLEGNVILIVVNCLTLMLIFCQFFNLNHGKKLDS